MFHTALSELKKISQRRLSIHNQRWSIINKIWVYWILERHQKVFQRKAR